MYSAYHSMGMEIQTILQEGELVKDFSASHLTAYSKKSLIGDALAPYTVVLPDKSSDRVLGIAYALKKLVPETVEKNIRQLEDSDLSSQGALVVLATIDGALEDEEAFLQCKELLTNVKRKIIWVLDGATSKSGPKKQLLVIPNH